MNEYLKAEKISDKVYWVGAIDWNVRNFHGYKTQRGSTYNAFLIMDEKVTLIDTVKEPFADEMLARISSIIDPSKIDYIVSNHSEPDHSGALPKAIEVIKPEKVFASSMGEKTLKLYYGQELDITVVSNNSAIPIGEGNIAFVDTKMLHWPDSMVTFYDKEGILFTQDAFGMHLAGSKRWAEDYQLDVLEYEAKKYFANILNHLAPKVLDLLKNFPSLNLDVKMILPDHGPLYKNAKEFEWIFNLYKECSEQKLTEKALVVYSTMWHSTEALANSLSDGLRSTGIDVKVIDIAESDRSEVMTEVASSSVVAFGAPTMNNQVYPGMADILNYVKGLRPKNKIGFAFGSFGWSGEGAKQISEVLNSIGAEQPVDLMQVKYAPSKDDAKKIYEVGVTLGNILLEKIKEENK